MANEITHLKTTEELELEKKLAELSALQDILAQLEMELQQLKMDVWTVEQMYHERVTARFARLAAVRERIRELLGELPDEPEEEEPEEEENGENGWVAEKVAQDENGNGQVDANGNPVQNLLEKIKSLYRELAKRFHPDLALDETDRAQRTEWMLAINEAYSQGDLDRLQAMLEHYETSPERVTGQGIAAEVERVCRKIAQVKRRIREIRKEQETLRESSPYKLKMKMERAGRRGQDWLNKICAKIDDQIAREEELLEKLLQKKESAGE